MDTSIESLPQRIANRLRERRLALGWSRRRLAERSAVAMETLRAFERTGQISLLRLVRICVALGVDQELERLFAEPPAPRSLDELVSPAVKRKRGR